MKQILYFGHHDFEQRGLTIRTEQSKKKPVMAARMGVQHATQTARAFAFDQREEPNNFKRHHIR